MTTRYYLEITCQVRGISSDTIFEPLADAVHELSQIIDPDLGATGNRFDFTMAVDAESQVEALRAGLAAVRTAIHATGGSTPGWEKNFEEVQQVVRREAALADA